MTPTVSIVIPAYNNAAFIEETMRSVLAQTHTELEVIVADHSSTDDTRARLEQFADDPRVRLVETPAGGGAARNWNRVSALASGEFVKLVCGDDLIHPECVALQVAAFEEGVAMVASTRDIVDARGRVIVRGRGLFGLVGRHDGRVAIRRTVRLGTNAFGEPASVMFRRSDFVGAGLWDGAESYLIDEASYARVLLRGDFVGIPQSLSTFRVSGGQWSVRLARSQAREADAWHRRFAVENPGLLSPADLRLGGLRVREMALRRRLTYLLLGKRLSPESA
jgi:glycosyltransferase involved in cell wall biosynthesis